MSWVLQHERPVPAGLDRGVAAAPVLVAVVWWVTTLLAGAVYALPASTAPLLDIQFTESPAASLVAGAEGERP
ncbi:hypothetical protein CX676_19825 (plasmid) [Paracoccus zhejiangensis]|uniref:Uncharacterized protein n=1 Tax=Paracoccus zhejiangensis TaxID=1077935 RepID=A0A2H5F4S7_9RHOB|nr:hypothetical protein CX676_19825 [Paracoccus zhejiangensis]